MNYDKDLIQLNNKKRKQFQMGLIGRQILQRIKFSY